MATCPRDGTELARTDQAGDLVFLACAGCGRRYALRPDGTLVERWLGPLSLALYGVIFDERPQDPDRVREQARGLRHLDVEALVREIRLELADPTQPVGDILPGMRAGEDDLREYLRLLADELER